MTFVKNDKQKWEEHSDEHQIKKDGASIFNHEHPMPLQGLVTIG